MMGEFCGFAFTLTGLFAFLGEIITVLAAMYQFFLSLLCIFFAVAGALLPSRVHCFSLSCLLVLFWIFPHKGCMNWDLGL